MLARVMRMFQLERVWIDRSPDARKALRDRHLRVHVVSFFVFVEQQFERVKHQRGLLRSALGYCVRQKDALMRFLDDGRLEMTNNKSERQLRRVATGRAAWLFVGSDDHGQAAGNLMTLIASARLHKLDPEEYLRDIFRVLPCWPRHTRMLSGSARADRASNASKKMLRGVTRRSRRSRSRTRASHRAVGTESRPLSAPVGSSRLCSALAGCGVFLLANRWPLRALLDRCGWSRDNDRPCAQGHQVQWDRLFDEFH